MRVPILSFLLLICPLAVALADPPPAKLVVATWNLEWFFDEHTGDNFQDLPKQEFIQYLSMAKGSCGEIRSQLYVALDQRYLSEERFKVLYDEAESINRMIASFTNYLQTSPLCGSKYKT